MKRHTAPQFELPGTQDAFNLFSERAGGQEDTTNTPNTPQIKPQAQDEASQPELLTAPRKAV